jgi:hypothetical protein
VTPAGLLLLLGLESLAAFLWAVLTPAEAGRQVLLWLSPPRLLLAVITLLIGIAFLGAWWRSQRLRIASAGVLTHFDGSLVEQGRLAPALLALTVLPILLAVAVVAILRTPLEYEVYGSWAPDTFPLMRSITLAALPLLALAALASVETAAFLAFRHHGALGSPSTWSRSHLGPSLLLMVIAIVTTLHWLVLVFQLRFFVNIPAWYWIFDPVRFGIGDLWYLLGALMLLGLAYWTLVVKQHRAVGLLTVFALGLFLQMGLGLMGGAGIETLRERYFTTYHQAYVARAAENEHSILENIRQYDALHGSNTFTTTKPPGLMAFYIGLEHLVNGYPSGFDNAARYARLSSVIVWLFPLLAAGTAVTLWAFARRLTGDALSLVVPVSTVLYVLTPSIALFTFFADQAIYPGVFLLGIWFTVRVIRGGSLLRALLLGVALYAAAFFSFTMLPLYAFAALYLLLHNWKEQTTRRVQRVLLTGLGITAGTLSMYFIGRTLLNYDFLPHFQRMASINHNFDFYLRVGQQLPAGPESLSVRLAQIARAAWVNSLDYAAAVGFPIYILFAVQAVRRLRALGKPQLPPADLVLLSLLASFLVLNLAGTAQGEVPRLWLFWLPMVVLLAAFELEPHLRQRPRLLLLLGGAQLITLMLTFHFQDLRM